MSDEESLTRREFPRCRDSVQSCRAAMTPQPVQSFASPHSVSVSTVNSDFTEFSRYRPSFGGPPGNPNYLGKMVPGLRTPGQAPVPVIAPDTPKLPFRMVNGVKEFHLVAMAVQTRVSPWPTDERMGLQRFLPRPDD